MVTRRDFFKRLGMLGAIPVLAPLMAVLTEEQMREEVEQEEPLYENEYATISSDCCMVFSTQGGKTWQ